MDDVLEEFVTQARQLDIELDFSFDSLDQLENLIIIKAGECDSKFENRAARYLGEVFRKTVGGIWELCLKDPKYVFFKLPVITGYSKHTIQFCPIEIITNFQARKESGLLKRAVDAHLEFKS